MFISVIIPTYNRRPILEKCLLALESQAGFSIPDKSSPEVIEYEVIVVDDGSIDGTPNWLRLQSTKFPHVCLVEQKHSGPAEGRNRGVLHAHGDVIIFIDSDLVVKENFLLCHARALSKSWSCRGNRLTFTYGAVINTTNFENPTSEPHKLRDLSWAYFATGNVAIDRKVLEQSGMFDTSFYLYGWEDLELGERLRQMGVDMIRCPEALGYHWHPPFHLDQIPDLIRVEHERAKMGLVFYQKHPTCRVRLIIQFTWLHRFFWELMTLGGLLNEHSLRPLLAYLVSHGHPGVAMEILRLPLNLIVVRSLRHEATLVRRR